MDTKTKAEDFIFERAGLGECEFCKRFGYAGNCPIKDAYGQNDCTDENLINKNFEICKSYVIKALKEQLIS